MKYHYALETKQKVRTDYVFLIVKYIILIFHLFLYKQFCTRKE